MRKLPVFVRPVNPRIPPKNDKPRCPTCGKPLWRYRRELYCPRCTSYTVPPRGA